jgi:hypothetical protein
MKFFRSNKYITENNEILKCDITYKYQTTKTKNILIIYFSSLNIEIR